MDWNAPSFGNWQTKLVIEVGKIFRSKKSFSQAALDRNKAHSAEKRQKTREKHAAKNGYQARQSGEIARSSSDVNELGERDFTIFGEAATLAEHPDHTDMLHRLAHHGSFDSLFDARKDQAGGKFDDPYSETRKVVANGLRRVSTRDERLIDSLPPDLWKRIASFLNPADAARLAIASKHLFHKFGSEPFQALNQPGNIHHKHDFLHGMDEDYPQHLLCFPCARYHLRSQLGKETLKANFVNNPLFHCPLVNSSVLPRMRLTHGRELPYSFVQLALRNHYSSLHGICEDSLARRWRNSSGWSYTTRYMVHDGRLLLRVVSQMAVPPAAVLTKTMERHILYDREEYTPFFSVCAHWRDGDLTELCKCAMSHVPSPPESYVQQLKKAPKISRSKAHPCFIVRGCDWCRPARRCPECPTEYLIEIQMVEDTRDPIRPFKHALIVTRWSDLGNGSSPYTSPEWAAITGSTISTGEEGQCYESFSHVGRRAVSGIFESRISGSIPGQRMLSLNPKNKKMGEEGHGWY